VPALADRVKETTTTTGTGAITLLGAVSQFQSLATAFGATSIVVAYAIVGQTGTEWETGEGTFNGTTGLTRTLVNYSSNANALVNFSAGTKDVFVTALSKRLVEECGTATIDFGTAAGGTNVTTVAVTGQKQITTAACIDLWFQGDATAGHTADEHLIAPMGIILGATTIVAATGFTIQATSQLRLTGTFTVHWRYRNG